MRRGSRRSHGLPSLGPLARRVAISLTLLVPSATSATAQHRFDSWTTENGLPQKSINDILLTRLVIFDRSTEGIESLPRPCAA